MSSPSLHEETFPPLKRRRRNATNACTNCRKRHLGCDGSFPCKRCVSLSLECVMLEQKKRGPKRRNATSSLRGGGGAAAESQPSSFSSSSFSSSSSSSSSPRPLHRSRVARRGRGAGTRRVARRRPAEIKMEAADVLEPEDGAQEVPVRHKRPLRKTARSALDSMAQALKLEQQQDEEEELELELELEQQQEQAEMYMEEDDGEQQCSGGSGEDWTSPAAIPATMTRKRHCSVVCEEDSVLPLLSYHMQQQAFWSLQQQLPPYPCQHHPQHTLSISPHCRSAAGWVAYEATDPSVLQRSLHQEGWLNPHHLEDDMGMSQWLWDAQGEPQPETPSSDSASPCSRREGCQHPPADGEWRSDQQQEHEQQALSPSPSCPSSVAVRTPLAAAAVDSECEWGHHQLQLPVLNCDTFSLMDPSPPLHGELLQQQQHQLQQERHLSSL